MKTLITNLLDTLTEAAMLEEGISLEPAVPIVCDPYKESIEELLTEVAFAEAADFEDIHAAIVHEHFRHCAAA